MRLLDAVKESSDFLENSGIEDSLVDAELLSLHAAGMDRLEAFLNNPEIGKDLLRKIRTLVRRRAKGEPLQYIMGYVEFLGLRIEVGRGVLIPRPETELVVEEAIKAVRSSAFNVQGSKDISQRIVVQSSRSKVQKSENINDRTHNDDYNFEHSFQVLDLCTGSGCIALALAKEFPNAMVYGTDISKIALRYAEKNRKINLINNVEFGAGRLFEPAKGKGKFDFIISNPPYIRSSDIKTLQREIRDWEPLRALDGGEEGMDHYIRIFAHAAEYLAESGKIIVELGFNQARGVKEIAKEAGFQEIEIRKDYAGIERILKATKQKKVNFHSRTCMDKK